MKQDKPKKPFYKKWWFWVLVFLFFVVMANANTSKKAPATQSDPEPKEVQETKAPETTEEKITTLIDELNLKYSDLEVSSSSGKVVISLHYDDTVWDETDFCRSCVSDYINLCQKAYELDGVEKVDYSAYVDLMDAKGNEAPEKGFQMCMAKSSFKSYTWKNLEYVPGTFDQIESDCEILFVYPGIKNKVNFDKFYYRG